MAADLFFYGTLCDVPLLEIVLGRTATGVAAHLADHRVTWVANEPFPMIQRAQGAVAEGVLVCDLSDEDVARLSFYEGGYVFDLDDVTVFTEDGLRVAQVFRPVGNWQPGAPWSLPDWQDLWGEITHRTAREVMERFGHQSAETVAGLMPFLRNRAWSQMMSAKPAPQTVRSQMTVSDVEVLSVDEGYSGFFRHRPFRLRYRRFDGRWGEALQRECFIAFDVALVLPYDPITDQVLLIEQLRFGPIHRGDPAPWVLEAVAGMVDARETPEEAARREAVEEAGLHLKALLPAPSGYASPGYTTEYYHNFLGVCDLSAHETGQTGGLSEENEDIRSHILSFDAAMALVSSGEINSMPLQMLLLALAARRAELRATA